MAQLGIGIIGAGYWGPKLIRNFSASADFTVAAIAERDPERRRAAGALAPRAELFEMGEDLITSPKVDAVVIATPVATHASLGMRALAAGKHIWVEKPMAASSVEAEALADLAEARRLTIFVNHTFLFTGAVQDIKARIDKGQLGKISYYDSLRVNLGLFQPDVNVVWDLAPHDFSIMDYLIGGTPIHVEATGFCHVNPHLADIAYVTLHYPEAFIAHFNLSWMSPVKVRRIAIGGSEKMIVWDDLNNEEKVKIYENGIRVQPEGSRGTILPSYRIGDIHSPRISTREALSGAVDHFAQVIDRRRPPLMGAEQGMRIVRLLERVQVALDSSLAAVAEGRRAAPVAPPLGTRA